MRTLTITLSFLLAFSFAAKAQQKTVPNWQGCWTLVKIELSDGTTPPGADEAVGSRVCLDDKGRFTTQAKERTVQGKYAVSADGKTMTQWPDEVNGGEVMEAEILLADGKKLDLKAEDAILHLEKSTN